MSWWSSKWRPRGHLGSLLGSQGGPGELMHAKELRKQLLEHTIKDHSPCCKTLLRRDHTVEKVEWVGISPTFCRGEFCSLSQGTKLQRDTRPACCPPCHFARGVHPKAAGAGQASQAPLLLARRPGAEFPGKAICMQARGQMRHLNFTSSQLWA